MENNNLLNKDKNFRIFLSMSIAEEIEEFILNSKFTSEFNYRMKKVFEQIRSENRKEIEFSIIFNTEGEISLIDSLIIGDFIADDYVVNIQEKYKNIDIQNIIKNIISGSDKGKSDFIIISSRVIYNILEMVYEDIKCRTEIIDNYINKYNLNYIKNIPSAVMVIILIIMEKVCSYMGINKEVLKECISSKSFLK